MESASDLRTIDLDSSAKSAWNLLNIKTGPDGLVPAVVQDYKSGKVLMLGYINQASWEKTVATRKVTFFSRSKQRLWTKGESSGNYLLLQSVALDCDRDALLLKVNPIGPTCHTGTETCWGNQEEVSGSGFQGSNESAAGFLHYLENIIHERKNTPSEKSYTNSLFQKGIPKIAQKVGEEAVETVIEALLDDKEKFLGESADLLYHFLVLLAAKGVKLEDVEGVLRERHEK